MPANRTKRTTKIRNDSNGACTITRASSPRIFIASSWKALDVARKLRRKLQHGREPIDDVVLWEDAFPVGGIILDTLRDEAARADFAVVLFTADDRIKNGRKEEALAPRDNCVFELGLFMGALGSDP